MCGLQVDFLDIPHNMIPNTVLRNLALKHATNQKLRALVGTRELRGASGLMQVNS